MFGCLLWVSMWFSRCYRFVRFDGFVFMKRILKFRFLCFMLGWVDWVEKLCMGYFIGRRC